MKWAWANTIVSLFAISTGKFTVVAFLQQLHTPHQRPQVIFLWLLASTNLIVNTMTVGTILGMCTPAAKLWNRTLPGTCDGIIRNQNCAYFQGSALQTLKYPNLEILSVLTCAINRLVCNG